MERRKFIKNMALATGALSLNNIPLRVLAQNSYLEQLAGASTNDRVLVIIQLHGGNDGLNTLIPIEQYTDYLDIRPNIALPYSGSGARNIQNLDPSLAAAKQVGIHPDMTDLRRLYDDGLASIVQAVAYENMNQSHFRSRDIWFMGGGSDDYLSSGWMGRYLQTKFPGYPEAYPNTNMPDPLAIEIGNGSSLAFHTTNTIPASLSIANPEQFYKLIDGVVGAPGVVDGLDGSIATPPISIEKTPYADELRWIMRFEEKSDQYAGRLRDVFRAGTNSANISYPALYPFSAPTNAKKNPLSNQLKLVARLLSGGVKTKIFLARIGGFDTHANQVEPSATTYGTHAAKLYHIFSAVKAFQDDLKGLGLDERVLTVTLSEFGRRAASNFSWGTDHGLAAPMFVFGKYAKPGVIGTNPDLKDLDDGNIRQQHDYRQVFNEVANDWLCATPAEQQAINFDKSKALPKLGILEDNLNPIGKEFYNTRYFLESCSPNPVKTETTFSYKINQDTQVVLRLFDSRGLMVLTIVNEFQQAGEHSVKADLSTLANGFYTYTITADQFIGSKKLVKV
jgi:uncharacterized protein (DUF1501 family)